MKLAVICDSVTGNTAAAARWIAEGMEQVPGIEARAFTLETADEAFINEAAGIVLGSPSYAALMTPALHQWLLGPGGKLRLAGKLGGAFATEQYTHGGGDLVIQSILIREMVSGMLCYSGGGSKGSPVIHLGPVGVNGNCEAHNGMELYRETFTVYGRRFAQKCAELFG